MKASTHPPVRHLERLPAVEATPRVPQPEALAWAHYGLFAALLLGICGLALFPQSSTRLYLWPHTAWHLGLGHALIWLALLSFAMSPRGGGQLSRWVGLGSLFWILGYTQGLFTSAFPTRAVLGALGPLLAVAVGFLTWRFTHGGNDAAQPSAHRRGLLGLLLGIGLAVAAASLLRWLPLLTESGPPRNAAPFGHASQTGLFGLLLLSVAVVWTWETSRNRAGWLLGGLGIFAGIALILSSQSRGALLGLAIVVVFAACEGIPWIRRRRFGGLLVAVVGAAAVLLVSPRLQAMAASLFSGELLGTDRMRLSYLTTGWHAFGDAPLSGYGAGTTDLWYPLFWDGTTRLSTAYQLHNLPLQVLTDAGLLGGLGLVLIAVGVLGQWFRQADAGGRTRHLAGAGVLAAVVASLGDYSLNVPVLAVFAGALVGMAVPKRSQRAPQGSTEPRRLSRICVAVLLAAALIHAGQLTLTTLQARANFASAMEAAESGDLSGFEVRVMAAHQADSSDPLYQNQRGMTWAEQALETREDAVARLALNQRARAAFEASLEIWPHQELPHAMLGWLLSESEPRRAIRHFQDACRLHPATPVLWLGLSRAYLVAGDPERAREALKVQLLAQPAFMTGDIWFEGPQAPALRAQVAADVLPTFRRLLEPTAELPQIAQLEQALQIAWKLPTDFSRAAENSALQRQLAVFLRATPPADPASVEGFRASVQRALKRPTRVSDLEAFAWPAYPPLPGETEAALAALQALASDSQAHVVTRNRKSAYPVLMRNLDAATPSDPPVVSRRLTRAVIFAPLLPRGVLLPAEALLQEAKRRGLLEPPAAGVQGDSASQESSPRGGE